MLNKMRLKPYLLMVFSALIVLAGIIALVGIIGLQMSFGYIGGMTLPPLYGVISSLTGRQDLLPAYLFILVALHFFVITMKNRKCGK